MHNIELEKIAEFFTESLSQVLRMMAGFEVTSIDCNQSDETSMKPSIMAAMILHGAKDTIVSLAMEHSTAAVIIAYMTGVLPEELSQQDLFDGIAELVNIMAGEVKTMLSNTPHHFLLTSPFSIGGQNLELIYKESLPQVCRRLMAGEMEIIFQMAHI